MSAIDTDTNFQEVTVREVREAADSWDIGWMDGWWFYIAKDQCPFTPEPGMTGRLYGKGIGYAVRGLVLNGHCCFYRTEEEDRQHHADLAYGKDAADLLRKWDAGETCHTIEMGGLGPGYEQALQITVFEILRYLLENSPDADAWSDKAVWKQERDSMERALFENPTVKKLGLSGAQWGAAVNLATAFYVRGPQAVLNEVDADRRTMVSKSFPSA